LPEALTLGWLNTPSWVAHWDEETWFPTSAVCGLKPHEERVEPRAAVCVADVGTGILTLQGHIFDTVVYVAPYVHWPESDAKAHPINPCAFFDMWTGISTRLDNVDSARLLSAWAQTLTGGITASYDVAQESVDQHCADLIAFILYTLSPAASQDEGLDAFCALPRTLASNYPQGDRVRFQMAMVLLLAYRRIFVTAHGHIRLGHPRTREGDTVVWLFGGRLLFVLRGRTTTGAT
jgi:hypothetical protein